MLQALKTPQQRAAFIIGLVGVAACMAALVGRGSYGIGFNSHEFGWQLYDLFIDHDFSGYWFGKAAIIGEALAFCGFIIAFQYQQAIHPLIAWIKTGRAR